MIDNVKSFQTPKLCWSKCTKNIWGHLVHTLIQTGSKALLVEYLESVDSFKKWPELYQACKFSRANHIYSDEQDDFVVDISQMDIG